MIIKLMSSGMCFSLPVCKTDFVWYKFTVYFYCCYSYIILLATLLWYFIYVSMMEEHLMTVSVLMKTNKTNLLRIL